VLPAEVATRTESAVVELRQYTLKPGRRDVLIDIFERHFIETQEEVGARIIGHFRDLDDPDRFVWLRGFSGMPARRAALEAFYGSDVWKENRAAVNETLVDHENVLLLRPAEARSGFDTGTRNRDAHVHESLVTATIWPLAQPVSAETVRLFADELAPVLREAGAKPLAMLVTEPSANNYPRLAIREGENVFVWFARFDHSAAYDPHAAALDRSPRWRECVKEIGQRLGGPPQTLRLAPAARSLLA
jgi:quinol monooxygenase YgiN